MKPVSNKGAELFDMWMKQQSDLIQGAARAHGERICMEQCLNTYKSASEQSLKDIILQVTMVYGLHAIEQDLAWYYQTQVLSPQQDVAELVRRYVDVVAPQSLNLVDAFDIPEHLLCAPIAQDWVKYNEVDNQGELIKSML